MKTNREPTPPLPSRAKFQAWVVCVTAIACFAAGSLVTARLMKLQQVKADTNRVFQLMIYHTLPAKVPALESVFRDVSKLQAKHDLKVVGYWVPDDDPAWANTFVYLLAHSSQEEAKKNWAALHTDPAFLPYRQQAAPLIERAGEEYKVDEVYMRPTDFSALK